MTQEDNFIAVLKRIYEINAEGINAVSAAFSQHFT